MVTLHLGKKPARPGSIKFSLADYLPVTALPTAPPVFGHSGLVDAANLGMLGNDKYGDCVWAGADHETMLWNAAAGTTVSFTEGTALSDYAASTGFNPLDPNSDQGTDMEEAAKYRRKTGVVDVSGARHTVGAYVAVPGIKPDGPVPPEALQTLVDAAYAFGSVGIGIRFPHSGMDQFDNHEPWDVVPGSPIDGGHYVPIVGRLASGNLIVVTWGALQIVTPAFITEYLDEAIVYLSTEFLDGTGKTIDGFDLAALNADLVSLGGAPAPVPTPPVPPVPPAPPVANPFPIDEVDPWLRGHQYTRKAKRAAGAIDRWLRHE